MLTDYDYDYDADILSAVEAGASGYLLKDAPPHELTIAVLAAAAGDSALAPVIASRLLTELRTPQVILSAREMEVLGAVAAGRSNTVSSVSWRCQTIHGRRRFRMRTVLGI